MGGPEFVSGFPMTSQSTPRAQDNGQGILLWSPSLRQSIEAAARESAPEEACGLLVGRSFPNGAVVFRIETARNVDPGDRRRRFEVSPEDFFRIDRGARGAGLEVVGVWHSHPESSAEPSTHDLAAAWGGLSYVIASLLEPARGVGSNVRSWRLRDGHLVEEDLVEQPIP